MIFTHQWAKPLTPEQRAAKESVLRRAKTARDFPSTKEELIALAAATTVAVIIIPPGYAYGSKESMMETFKPVSVSKRNKRND